MRKKLKKLQKDLFLNKEDVYSTHKEAQDLLRSVLLFSVAPILVLVILVMNGHLNLNIALSSGFVLIFLNYLFVRPYIKNLAALLRYIKNLARNKEAEEPDLSFVNNLQQLTGAISELNESWFERNNRLESLVSESNILVDIIPDILLLLDEDMNLIKTNRTAKKSFGGHLFDKAITQILDDSYVKNLCVNAMKGRRDKDYIFYLPDPVARYYIVRAERFPVYSPGSIALMIVMHDITDLKNTEQMLSDFVANASHEIRTPLTSIKGFIETIQESAKDDPKAIARFLGIMEEQAERMSDLIDGLLSLSQIEKHKNTKPVDIIDVDEVLENVMPALNRNARAKNIEILVEAEKSAKIKGDISEIGQLFENLVNNAIKYSDNDKKINISVNSEENDGARKIFAGYKRLVSITVADQGCGISEKHIPRLTERFYRVDGARSRKVGGSGLGLSIVKYIIDRHKGTLEIESKLDEGSVFIAKFPAV